jgi:two-component system LytT family response regulator
MLSAVIIEDEESARNVLKFNLEEYCTGKVTVLGEAEEVKSGVKLINKYKPDLVFLDIEMPNYSGFELLDFFDEINFEIIFITAYSNHAIRAFEVSAIDYLLKPINIERLQEAIDKVHLKKMAKENDNRLKILENYLSSKKLEKISIPFSGGYYALNVDDIIAVKAERSYAYIYYQNDRLLVSKSLNKIEELLKETSNFLRIHRSFLINQSKILSYNKNDRSIQLQNDVEVKFSKDNLAEIEEIVKRL